MKLHELRNQTSNHTLELLLDELAKVDLLGSGGLVELVTRGGRLQSADDPAVAGIPPLLIGPAWRAQCEQQGKKVSALMWIR